MRPPGLLLECTITNIITSMDGNFCSPLLCLLLRTTLCGDSFSCLTVGLRRYAGAETLQRNYATCKHAGDTPSCSTPVQTARFPRTTGASIAHARSNGSSMLWEGLPVFTWAAPAAKHTRVARDTTATATARQAVQSVLVASVDLATTPSLAGRAVYFALQAQLPAAATAAAIGLIMGIDSGNGTWQYSDARATRESAQPPATVAASEGARMHAPGKEWAVVSYQAVLWTNGTARFAVFSMGGADILLSGPIAVAAVGTRYSRAAINML